MELKKINRGFTLIELLLVVAIIGVITTSAIAPLVYTVIRVVEAEELYNDEEAMQRGLSLIIKDISETMRTVDGPTIRTLKKEALGMADDYTIIITSIAPARHNLPAGCVVYRITKNTMFTKLPEGLYRWTVPLKSLLEVDPDKLEEDNAQLVLPSVTSLKAEMLIPPDWSAEAYSGKLPAGIRISLARGEKKVERVEWLPY